MKDLATALGVIAVFILATAIWTYTLMSNENDTSSWNTVETAENTDADAREISPPEQQEPGRYIVDRHIVIGGESFSVVTGMYWNDYFLWPDLYIRNEMLSEDPDLIFPYEVIDIYNRPGNGNNFTEAEKSVIFDSYIKVYNRFKKLGPQKNASAWTLLWCATKYDRDFLSKYADRIESGDIAKAREYIAEEGYLD